MLARDFYPKEFDKFDVKYIKSPFINWGENIKNQPLFTFFPKTLEGVRNVVTWAHDVGKKVRVSGYRHSWTPVFSENNEILISLMGYKEATELPVEHEPLDGSNPFQFVKLVGQPFTENGQKKHLCQIGSATTNEQFRKWVIDCFNKKGVEHSWTLPLNVVMVENTIGGTTALACHGAGIQNKTLSDLVTEIEFVNPKGVLQKVGYQLSDSLEQQEKGKELIKTAASSFGMLGVVTAITLKLDQLTFARMKPTKPRLALAVPPPKGFIPSSTLPPEIFAGVTKEDLIKAEKDFISRCENDYYSEWFWFSLHPDCWVNTWKNEAEAKDAKDYPLPVMTKAQEIQLYLFELANQTIMKWIPKKLQTNFISGVSMALLPTREIVTPLVDALHFRRGIQNMRVEDMEFEIPIPALPDGKPDWSICQKAWWDAVTTVYEWLEKKNKIPMRLPLEMRVMGGSDVTMAAQHGNQLGTCSIEVLTMGNELIPKEEWLAFMQAITDKWSSYTDFQGKPLNIRPHWAKQWEGLTIKRPDEKRQDIVSYLKNTAYKNEIPIFKQHLKEIATQGGYKEEDLKMFSNTFLDKIFNEEKQSLGFFSKRKPIATMYVAEEKPKPFIGFLNG